MRFPAGQAGDRARRNSPFKLASCYTISLGYQYLTDFLRSPFAVPKDVNEKRCSVILRVSIILQSALFSENDNKCNDLEHK